jgi:hypothetical protein
MMTRQGFMTVGVGVSIVTGLAALLAPMTIASVFGVTLNEAGAYETRLLGTAYLGYAVLLWFAREVRDVTAQRAIALGNFVSWTLGMVVTAAGIVTGNAGPQTWSLVAVGVAFAVAWGYFSFVDRTEAAAA